MRAEEILQHVRAQPYRPVRLHLSDGTDHDVRLPQMIMVTRTHVIVATRLRPSGVADDIHFCDPRQVTRLEFRPTRKKSSRGAK